jgi:hypothetical protein
MISKSQRVKIKIEIPTQEFHKVFNLAFYAAFRYGAFHAAFDLAF